MKKTIISSSIAFGFLLGALAITTYATGTWTAPTLPPPDGNVEAPINAGPIGQVKQGSLYIQGLNENGIPYINGLIVKNGNVGIGTDNPTSVLTVDSEIPFLFVKKLNRRMSIPQTVTTRCECDISDITRDCTPGIIGTYSTRPSGFTGLCKDMAVLDLNGTLFPSSSIFEVVIESIEIPILDIKRGQLNTESIRIQDGTEGINKVLSSDANGVGQWEDIKYFFGVAGSCEANKYMTGFNADGTIKCVNAPASTVVVEDVYGAWNNTGRDVEACRDHYNSSDTCSGNGASGAFSSYTCSAGESKTCTDYAPVDNWCQKRSITCKP